MKRNLFSAFLLLITLAVSAQVSEVNFNTQNIDFSAPPRTALSAMSIKLWDNYNNGGPSTYGTVLEIYGKYAHQTGQLYFGGWDDSKIRYREAFYAQNTWSPWITMLDSKNNVESAGSLKITGPGSHYISQGNMGIGTTSPATALHVNGATTTNYLDFSEGNQTIGYLGRGGAITTGWASIPSALTLSYMQRDFAIGGWSKTSGSWQGASLFINSDNSFVGIGTTSPDQKLTVNGNIHATAVKIEATVPTPDYVFDDSYNLRTLTEVADFISKNQHLPEVASASEMKAKGIDVAEINMLLLKKVEELTLYMIQKDKEVQELKDRLAKIENKN